MKVQGAAQWNGSLLSHTFTSSATTNMFADGGVVVFLDGTIWSVRTDNHHFTQHEGGYSNTHYNVWSIYELTPGSEIWECLTPDMWGEVNYGYVEGTVGVDASPNFDYVSWDAGFIVDGPSTGKIKDYFFYGEGWRVYHSQKDGNDDLVIMMNWDGYGGDEALGPLVLNRRTRTWERFYFDEYTVGGDTDGRYNPWNGDHNITFFGGYAWRISYYDPDNPAFSGGAAGDGYLIRAPMSDLSAAELMHTWTNDWVGGLGPAWERVPDTSKVDFYDVLNNQHWNWHGENVVIDDEGWLYLFQNGTVTDGRTTGSFDDNVASDRNYNVTYSVIKRCQVDGRSDANYVWEVVYWHRSPEHWVGEGNDLQGFGGENYPERQGTFAWGQVERAVTYDEDPPSLLRGVSDYATNDRQFIATGLESALLTAPMVRDGWLYFIQVGNRGSFGYGGTHGEVAEFCRFRIEDLSNGPVRHDPFNPLYESLSNCSHPWDSGWDGHMGNTGDWIEWREGPDNLYGHIGQTWDFNADGEIIFQHLTYPHYVKDAYAGGDGGSLGQGQPGATPSISKLSPPELTAMDITVTFEGSSLKGYSNVRQIPTSPSDRTLELK